MSAVDVMVVLEDDDRFGYVVHAGATSGSVRLERLSIVGSPGALLNLADALTVAADAIVGTAAGVVPIRQDARAVPVAETRGGAA